jgi:hypothetical protein
MRRTGDPQGTPRIDGERAAPAQKETAMMNMMTTALRAITAVTAIITTITAAVSAAVRAAPGSPATPTVPAAGSPEVRRQAMRNWNSGTSCPIGPIRPQYLPAVAQSRIFRLGMSHRLIRTRHRR